MCIRDRVHEHGTVAVEHDDRKLRTRERDAEPHRRGESHGMLQVELIRAMPNGLQLGRHRTHDRDDDAIGEVVVDGPESVYPQHRTRDWGHRDWGLGRGPILALSLIHISEPTRLLSISYA